MQPDGYHRLRKGSRTAGVRLAYRVPAWHHRGLIALMNANGHSQQRRCQGPETGTGAGS